MNTIIKQVLAFSLSLFLVIAPTIQQANAASSWSITGAVSAGARTIVSASKSGYKSAVNIMPTAARLGAGLLRVGNTASLMYAAAQLGNDGIDFVLDPANNRIKYKVKNKQSDEEFAMQWCKDKAIQQGRGYYGIAYTPSNPGVIYCAHKGGIAGWGIPPNAPPVTKTISIPEAAAQVLKNAQSGNSSAQSAVRAVATEMVVAGDFDADLLSGAVPTSDTRPLIPSVPGNQNGNVTPGTDPGLEGATPGTQADAAKAAADAAKAAADAAAQAAKDAQNQAANDAADAQDLINSAADQAAIDAANARAAAAEKAAANSKAVADRAAQAAADAAKAADRAAAQAAAQAAADAKAAQAAAQAAIDAVKAAAEADKAAAQAAADAAVRAADAAKAQAEARAKAAEEAAKAAEKAKAEAQKPFELPAFCSWAAPVCDAVEWLMKPAPDLDDDTELDIDTPDISPVDTDINFGGSCPANFEFNGSMFGNPINIVLLDTSKFCSFLSTFVKFPVYAASSLFALYILGGRKDV